MPDHELYHPRPPGPKADAGDRLIYRLDARLTQLENSRRHGVDTIDRDMDSTALLWQRTHSEFTAAMHLERLAGLLAPDTRAMPEDLAKHIETYLLAATGWYGLINHLEGSRQAPQLDVGKLAIVLADQETRRLAYKNRLFPATKSIGAPKFRRTQSALTAGWLDGKATVINKPLDGSQPILRLT